jgi:hypothetical protein
MEGKAEYLWVTGSGEHAVPHKELRLVKTETHSLPKGLVLRVAGEEKPLRDGEKLAYKEGGKKLSVKDCAKLLRAEAERTVPEKRSKITFTEENFVVSYLPVLKVLIVFEGKTYSAFVNLVNGDCVAEYAVSEKLTAAVAKTINTVKNRRSFIFVTFLYTLAFAVMGFVKFFEGSLSGVVTPALLAGLAVVLLLFWGQCFAYKKEKLLNKGIETGKMPKAKYALFLSVLSAVIAVAAIVLFALQIL